MKQRVVALAAVIVLVAASAVAQELPVQLGPNGGQLLMFNKSGSILGEATVQEGKLHLQLLDADKKPIPLDQHVMEVYGGDRLRPDDLPVEKKDGRFVAPIPVGNDIWFMFKMRPNPGSKPYRARLHYNTAQCPKCEKPMWLCECAAGQQSDAAPAK